MPQCAERRQPAAPQILFGNIDALLVGFSGFDLGHSVDDYPSSPRSALRSMSPPVSVPNSQNFLFSCYFATPDLLNRVDLPQPQVFANLGRVNLLRIELRYVDSIGEAHALSVAPARTGETSTTHRDIVLSARLEHAIGGTMIHATIANHSDEPIRLDTALFEVATGIAPGAPTRFFKHGYQSWSSSNAVDITTATSRTHPRDGAPFLTRMSHQSESTRPAEFPEMLTSELFTIVESPTLAERIMPAFVGPASALTTVTVPSPEKIVARAILHGVTLAPPAHR